MQTHSLVIINLFFKYFFIKNTVWVYKLGPEGNDPFGNKQYEYAIVR